MYRQTRLRRRRRTHAVPQGQEPPRAVRGQRSRHAGGARATAAPEVRAYRAGRGDPGLRRALCRRGQYRPRRRVAHGLRAESAGLDRHAQLRLRHAGAGFGRQQYPRRALQSRARGRRRCTFARAAAGLRRDDAVAGGLVPDEVAGAESKAAGQAASEVPRAGDRHHEGPYRPDCRPADGADGGKPRASLRHHARADGRVLGRAATSVSPRRRTRAISPRAAESSKRFTTAKATPIRSTTACGATRRPTSSAS